MKRRIKVERVLENSNSYEIIYYINNEDEYEFIICELQKIYKNLSREEIYSELKSFIKKIENELNDKIRYICSDKFIIKLKNLNEIENITKLVDEEILLFIKKLNQKDEEIQKIKENVNKTIEIIF